MLSIKLPVVPIVSRAQDLLWNPDSGQTYTTVEQMHAHLVARWQVPQSLLVAACDDNRVLQLDIAVAQRPRHLQLTRFAGREPQIGAHR